MQLDEEIIRKNEFCFLENSIAKESYLYLFTSLVDEVIVYDNNQVKSLFKRIAENQAKGFFAVGYFSYECGIGKYSINSEKLFGPLAHFVFYKNRAKLIDSEIKELFIQIKKQSHLSSGIVYDLSFNMSYSDYEIGFNKIQQHLLDGDSYQVNYTGQYRFKLQGSSFDLYTKIRSKQLVSYGAYLPFSSGPVLSFSPELFFTKSGNFIKTKPMKGTVKRYVDLNKDALQRDFLRQDIKNQSENLIIVDLLRNDLSRIAEVGSVKVNKLFDIEAYQSVYQMTSEIEAEVDSNLPVESLFQALFPCGSITGAPKKKTMEIINRCEDSPRGIYTGCIGYISPDNDMSFNVAIRTLQFNQNNKGMLGVGGGITTRSTCLNEWQEMHLKAQFFYNAPKDFELIETLLFDNEYVFFEEHIERLACSCKYFGFQFDKNKICKALLNITSVLYSKHKVRLLYDQHGNYTINHEVLSDNKNVNTEIVLSKKIMNSQNILLSHKTTSDSVRGIYNKAYSIAVDNGFCDVFFQNEKGNVTETSRYNIIYQKNGIFYTPPLSDGLLPGIYRQYLIKQNKLIEKSISITEIQNVDEVYICNSVQGMLPVNIIIEG